MGIQTKDKFCIVTQALFITAFIFSLFRTDLFALRSGPLLKEIDDLENEEQPPAIAIETIVRPKPEYKATGLRDPFQSQIYESEDWKATQKAADIKAAAEEEKPLPSLNVQGVIWGGNFPQAIINDKVVKVGDVVEGVSIVNIDKYGIEVFFENRKHILPSPAVGAVSSKEPGG